MKDDHREELPLPEALRDLIEEARMVLPGIQALFGFQLVAVFSSGFKEDLTAGEQMVHLAAIALVAIAVALVMSPAAYHRQTDPQGVTQSFMDLASRFLLASMLPLIGGITLDFYLIARVILKNAAISLLLAIILAVIYVWFWYILPNLARTRSPHRDGS